MNSEDGGAFLTPLKNFIVNELLDGRDAGFDEFTPLLEWGIVDSISMARLLAFVRVQFGFKVDQSAVTAANVVNLAAFASYLTRIRPGVTVKQARDVGSEVVPEAHSQSTSPPDAPPT
jgi:hypothetical protein